LQVVQWDLPMKSIAVIFVFFAALSPWVGAGYGSMQLASGPNRVSLLELYTSEGCSSCPPADRWLSALRDDERLWKDIVPVALHVDYWDYIGWDDRFAQAKFSMRQRRHADLGASRAVYTPGFFCNGEEWLAWRRNQTPTPVDERVGELSLELKGNRVAATFNDASGSIKNLDLVVAIAGMGLETNVGAGENRGRALQHDFVVLQLQRSDMAKRGATFRTLATLPDVSTDAEQLALVAWVSVPGTQTPVQAVGGYLPSVQ
jgi:hypothetical protein